MENKDNKNPGSALAKFLLTVFVAEIAAITMALTAKLIEWMVF
jgi:hypothetical protein